MSHTDKGFNTDAIITINNWNDHEGKLKVFANEIQHIPGIAKVLLQGNAPMGFAQSMDNYTYKGKQEQHFDVSAHMGNQDFIPFYQMKIIAGRNMLPGDSLKEVVINTTFAKAIGFSNPSDAIGKLLYQQGYQAETQVSIVGVVADFHTGSFHEAIRPTVIENIESRKSSVAIKLAPALKNMAGIQTVLEQTEAQWKKIFPETAFRYTFLNDEIAQLYDQERKTEWLMNIAMTIAIFISCMGLFGLGMFTAQRRTKEIGIRKVLGATVANIIVMLSKDFVVLVLVALLIASPIAWYLSNQWLQDFAYRTKVSAWLFIVAGAFAVVIALVTVSVQAIKAAIANPVKSLRTE
jgi:ABC-type antimicrobial peptide transport system permease subunit